MSMRIRTGKAGSQEAGQCRSTAWSSYLVSYGSSGRQKIPADQALFMKKPEKKLGCLGLNSRETLLLEWPETAEVHCACMLSRSVTSDSKVSL